MLVHHSLEDLFNLINIHYLLRGITFKLSVENILIHADSYKLFRIFATRTNEMMQRPKAFIRKSAFP